MHPTATTQPSSYSAKGTRLRADDSLYTRPNT
ncbi:hypothetical protein PF006_g15186 [Phytophthora fragariae]|uniref:Uncharacterized protein n=1 Tax=Phytophthora fragariae TaxID=53985 RepID=A0A6A3TFF5_9STRA|nr:hypothetical protein PF003_g18483 [Phytophthora fragariae]KAE8998380.1 hypothetical protein PF011_g15081 [Phytophthora fragariae]KAE9132831.1 hypothetical protein PF006_g15186 [Phytophthora fragariae]